MALTSYPQSARREPIFDVHPLTGISIEVFYADPTLETFGKCGAGWFYWARQRGFSPEGPATGPFATSYAAYRNAMIAKRCSAATHGAAPERTPPENQT